MFIDGCKSSDTRSLLYRLLTYQFGSKISAGSTGSCKDKSEVVSLSAHPFADHVPTSRHKFGRPSVFIIYVKCSECLIVTTFVSDTPLLLSLSGCLQTRFMSVCHLVNDDDEERKEGLVTSNGRSRRVQSMGNSNGILLKLAFVGEPYFEKQYAGSLGRLM